MKTYFLSFQKNRILLFLFLLFTFQFFHSTCSAQTIYIGTDTVFNDQYTYPAPYGNYYNGARHQFLIRASELTAMGMSAGFITGLGFHVYLPSGTTLSNFTIKIRTTNNNALAGNFTNNGWTQVWGAQNYTDSAGWNNHVLITPFQ